MTSASSDDETASMWELALLFEDEFILAVNKPPGLPTQSGHDQKRPNLYGLLQEQQKQTLFLHHRLDKDTSGVLLLAKHPRANKGMTELFREHQIQKTYLAIAQKAGAEPPPPSFSVLDHLAPVRGSQRQLVRMVKVKSGGWRAETHFRCLESWRQADLWEAQPRTGRTHQIRVHLAGVKRPILGDFLYGGKSDKVARLLLHAKSLQFKHPVTGLVLNIEAPLPNDFLKAMQSFSESKI